MLSPVSLSDYHGWTDFQVHGFANVPRSKPLDLIVPHLNMIILVIGHPNDDDDDDDDGHDVDDDDANDDDGHDDDDANDDDDDVDADEI